MTIDESTGLVIEVVRNPDPEHREAVVRLLPQLSSAPPPELETLRSVAGSEAVYVIFARDSDDFLGMLTLVVVRILTGVRSIIEDVVVDEAARGRGVGEALVRHALELARTLGARTVDLTSRPERAAANRLYLRAGFVQRETNVYRIEL